MITSTFTALVLSVSGQSVTVDLGPGGTVTLQKLRHVTVAAGDLAQITSTGRARFVSGVIGAGTAPAVEAPISVPPSAPQDASSGSWTFPPSEPGTWRDGWRTDTSLLWQGRYGTAGNQQGAAWYGLGPQALPGVLVDVQVGLLRVAGAGGAVSPQIALYAETERPTGAPTVLDVAAGPGLLLDVPTTWSVPSGWLAQLDAGTAGGLGCSIDGPTPSLALSAEGAGMSITCFWEDQ